MVQIIGKSIVPLAGVTVERLIHEITIGVVVVDKAAIVVYIVTIDCTRIIHVAQSEP